MRRGSCLVEPDRIQAHDVEDAEIGGRVETLDVIVPDLVDPFPGDRQQRRGELAGADGPVSVFVDIIGMPFTPLSFAGVARRTARRAYWYGAAAAPYYRPYGYPGYYPPPYAPYPYP
jgi:hypothetical protein